MNNWFNRNGIHLAIVALFVVLCFAYFSPVLQGKAPRQDDVLQAKAMQTEIMDVKAKEGKGPLWTNQMFGGMPAYQIWVQYPSNVAGYGIDLVTSVLPNPVGTVLLYLLGAYLLFCVLKINPWLAAAGAIAFSFASYNFIIIAAGHSNKALAIGFFAPILASIILTLRGRYLLGGSLTALFMALEIRSNHIQMTYYLFIALLILIGIELYHAFKIKQLKAFGKAMAFLSVGMVVALLINAGTLWTTYEYGLESTRGKSNITTDKTEPTNGLDRDYAYQWSQGVGESFTFLIPNLYGGGSGTALNEKGEFVKILQDGTVAGPLQSMYGENANQALQAIAQNAGSQYWGDKPGTAGPYYFGAIICLLFVFGLFIVKHRWKWWVVSASALLLLLSFGQNFPFVSNLFFAYFPLYNKFRAVESTLAVLALLVPLLAILAIKEAQEGKYDQKYLVQRLTWSAGIVGGFTLIVALMPTAFFSFTSGNEQSVRAWLNQVLQNNNALTQKILNSVIDDRIALAKADAWRTILFIAIGFGLTWAFITKKINTQLAFGLLALFILVDLWQVDRRYLNNDNFQSKSELANHFPARDVDQIISTDKDPDFRVFDSTIQTFSNASTTAFHKTVGGYHAAKLKRFDELIRKQFDKSVNQDVLDMLNTKYMITQDPKNGAYTVKRNPTACGNAWFVQSVQFVKNSDEEMGAISSFDAKKEAIVDQSYKNLIDTSHVGTGQEGFIKLTKYSPDHLTYEYSTAKDAIAVFSEIYYNRGWKMYVDDVEKPYFRADYVLRAAQLPAGNHKVDFKFHPTSYYMGEKISLLGSILLVGGLGFAFYSEEKKKRKKA